MMGFTLSPLVFGPLSENIGRRPVLVGSYTFYTIFTLCCAVAPTYSLLLLFRFFAGTSAAVPNAVVAGLYGDTFGEPKARGQAMAVFMLVSAQGPLFGPLLSGFLSVNLSWRWVFWVGLMISGTGLPVVWLVPETNARILETRHTQVTDTEWTRPDIHTLLKSVGTMLARPGAMIIQEPILLFSSFYLALVYAMMYLLFQAYPIVFGGIYGFSQDRVGLAYIPSKIFPWFPSHPGSID
jgi:MFS family permease